MKKGLLFGLSHRDKRVEKMNLPHFSVSTLENFLILKLPEPSTNSEATAGCTLFFYFRKDQSRSKSEWRLTSQP